MAKPNYSFEKRQRELAKKRKKEDKEREKADRKVGGDAPSNDETGADVANGSGTAGPRRARNNDDTDQNRQDQQHPQAHERKRLGKWRTDLHADETGAPEHDEQAGCARDKCGLH